MGYQQDNDDEIAGLGAALIVFCCACAVALILGGVYLWRRFS